jgi:hypothetical protein
MQFLKILLVMGVIGVVCWTAGLMLDWFSFRVRFLDYLISAGGSFGGIWAAEKTDRHWADGARKLSLFTPAFCALVLPSVIFHQWMEAEKEAEARKKEVRKDIWQKRIAPHDGPWGQRFGRNG